MESKGGILKPSTHIVMHNFCQFLPSSLLLCYFMAVIPPTSTFVFITLFVLYASASNKFQSNPNPNPNFSSIPFYFDACRESGSLLLLCLFINLTGVSIERPAMALGMVIFLVLELGLGFVYTGFTLRSLATFSAIAEESGARVQAMERWSFSLVRSWTWVSGFAMGLLIFLFISPDSKILIQIWNWSIACACVGLPALLFLYIRSAQVALYLACKTYHIECKETLITHTSQHCNKDLDNH